MGRDALGDPGHDLLRRCLLAKNDVTLGDLLSRLVDDTDHRGVRHLGVGEQVRLQLRGWNLEALVLDQFLEAVDDVVFIPVVDVPDVAGVEEAIGVDRVARGLLVVEVALHHLGPANPDLAVRVASQLGTTDDVDDLAFRVGNGRPDRTGHDFGR